MDYILNVNQLNKSYGNLKAVDDLSIHLKEGEVFGLLGPNGAGKTSSIECILGTKTFDKGSVSILGFHPTSDRKELFEHVGVQFQEAKYQENIRVLELCQVTASLYQNPADYSALLKKFSLSEKSNSYIKDLSGGEKQRLFIILALIPNPRIVFLDELTTGLDPRARRDVWKILLGLKKEGLSILLTSHFMDEVELLCDTLCILKKGKTVFHGTVTEAIKKSPYTTFEDAYLWYTDEGGQPL
jgi:ABC-2 type transport system ATP-binding protein